MPFGIAHQPPVFIDWLRIHVACSIPRLCRSNRSSHARRHRLQDRRALQQTYSVTLVQNVERVRLPSWLGVQQHLIPRRCLGHHGVLRMLRCQCIKLVDQRLVGRIFFSQPTDLALLRAHFHPRTHLLLCAFQHHQLLPRYHLTGTVGNRRHAVAQKRLLRRHIDILLLRLGPKLLATAKRHAQNEQRQLHQPLVAVPKITPPPRGLIPSHQAQGIVNRQAFPSLSGHKGVHLDAPSRFALNAPAPPERDRPSLCPNQWSCSPSAAPLTQSNTTGCLT